MERDSPNTNQLESPSTMRDGSVGLGWNVESQERSLDRISEWIRSADSKSSTILAIDTGMIATIVGLSARPGGWSEWSGAWILVGGSFLLASLVMVAISILPQLTGGSPSLIFFGDIASLDSTAYAAQVGSRTPADYLKDLTAQCHRNSEIASRKYRWIQRATMILIVGIVPWLIALFYIVRG